MGVCQEERAQAALSTPKPPSWSLRCAAHEGLRGSHARVGPRTDRAGNKEACGMSAGVRMVLWDVLRRLRRRMRVGWLLGHLIGVQELIYRESIFTGPFSKKVISGYSGHS